jgi:uncharacterized protein YaeQ
MALTATIYQCNVELAHVDRGIYETLDLRLARQPSESAEYMVVRLLAYCLEYEEGIAFTQGVAAKDEPAVWVKDLTGRLLVWIEVGIPDAERLHRGSRAADRVAVYTHRDVDQFLNQLSGKRIHRAEEIPIYALNRRFVEEFAALLDRRTDLAVTVTEGQLYVTVGATTLNTILAKHYLANV